MCSETSLGNALKITAAVCLIKVMEHCLLPQGQFRDADLTLEPQSGPAPPALFEVKGTISVDTALDSFIMIIIR